MQILKAIVQKQILIAGFGREGVSTLRFLRKTNPTQKIAIYDQKELLKLGKAYQKILQEDKNLKLFLGIKFKKVADKFDIIFKSPGIPNRYISTGILPKVISQTQIFLEEFSGLTIGITGTKGKSTTSSLIYEILKTAGRKTVLLGNIGFPPLDHLEDLDKNTTVVFELSSHQLSTVKKSPHIAVLLNIYPEHLDYYRNFKEYVLAKANITKYQSKNDFLVFNEDDPIVRKIAANSCAQKVTFGKRNSEELKKMGITTKLLGDFNHLNILAAIKVGQILNVSNKDLVSALNNFTPLEHRLELVGTFRGITFYNDSLSTIPQATIAALDALGDKVETIFLGGFDRGIGYKELATRILNSKIKNIILFPTTGEKIWSEIVKASPSAKTKFRHFSVGNMENAVRLGYKYTSAGKICLLSSASTSFSTFVDYRDRGNQFKMYVKTNNKKTFI